MNKRAAINWVDQWGEVYAFLLLVVGLLIALIADASIVNYIVILLCGIVVGRLYAMRRARLGAPFYLVVIGFLIGFLIGASLLRQRGNPAVLVVLFGIGCYFGSSWYKKQYIK